MILVNLVITGRSSTLEYITCLGNKNLLVDVSAHDSFAICMIKTSPELVRMPRKIDVEGRNEERAWRISHESQKTGENLVEHRSKSH